MLFLGRKSTQPQGRQRVGKVATARVLAVGRRFSCQMAGLSGVAGLGIDIGCRQCLKNRGKERVKEKSMLLNDFEIGGVHVYIMKRKSKRKTSRRGSRWGVPL
jgi:hypothetical protein